jgi:hypothetical protein
MELQMRTLLLLSAVAILGACSDNQSTAPTASRSPNRSAAGDVSPSNPGSAGGQAKPQDQVGFTTVTTVTGTTADLNNNGLISNTSTATCPAGTHAIAGGYTVNFGLPSVKVQRTVPNNTNGWTVTALLDGALSSAQFVATAVCIS